MDTGIAYLSNDKEIIKFQYGNRAICFRGPYLLEYFASIKKWNNSYLVVMAKYRHNQEPEEEYIDLIPVLKSLHIDATQFLKSIQEVRFEFGKIKQQKSPPVFDGDFYFFVLHNCN